MTERGPLDLEEQIQTLKELLNQQQAERVALYAEVKKYREENEALQKQKIYLQKQCRRAGKAILDQEITIGGLKKDIDRLTEERDNFETMLRNG